MKKVLCLMDYGKDCRTGFATVSRNIKYWLRQHFGKSIAFDICAVNHFGDTYEEEDGTLVFSAKRNDVKQDDFGRFAFLKILAESDEYDGIFIIQDLGVIQPIISLLQHIKKEKLAKNRKNFKSIWYFPVDCVLWPSVLKDVEFFDELVTYTEFARNEVLRLRPELRQKLNVIYHGNNPKEFYEMDMTDALKFREEFFGKNHDKFIIINVNRNQPRKDLPTTIFAFVETKKRWAESGLPSEPFLYLHAHPLDPMGHDLRQVFSQTGLVEGEDFMLIPERYMENMAPLSDLNGIYNSANLFVTSTLGEGWGLSITESMAAGTPVICPNTTSMTEIVGQNEERGWLLNTIIPFCASTDSIVREQCDYMELADKIIEVALMYQTEADKVYLKAMAAQDWVAKNDWRIITDRWIELFKKTLKL